MSQRMKNIAFRNLDPTLCANILLLLQFQQENKNTKTSRQVKKMSKMKIQKCLGWLCEL